MWSTKYRYKVLEGDVQLRCRELLIQICDSEDISILKGVVSCDHVHIEYPPKVNISGIVKRLKGRSSRILQKGFSKLNSRYWGQRLWAVGYGAWSTGNITDEMVNDYLEHHRKDANDSTNFILE